MFLTTQNNDKFNKSIYHQNNALKQQGAFIWGRVWRYQRSNQNPYIEEEEEETTQLPKENEQRDKQRSTKQTYKTKDRVKLNPLKTASEIRCSGRISSSCSNSDTRCVNLVTNQVISHAWGKDREVHTTSGTYPRSLVRRYSITVNQVIVASIKLSKWRLQLN